MVATFTKFDAFVGALAEGVHALGTASCKVLLSNTFIDSLTFAVKADVTEIAAGNGYAAGGNAAAVVFSGQFGGIYSLVLGNPATWTCVGAPMATFQYAVLYNSTPAAQPLIGWWNYGAAISLGVTGTFVVELDDINGVLTIQ